MQQGLCSLLPKLEWTAYLSTVGVYGDHQANGWMKRPPAARSLPAPGTGCAEEAWQAAAKCRRGTAGRSAPFWHLRAGTQWLHQPVAGYGPRLVKPGQVFNRIRVEDIGRATLFLSQRNASGVFNVTDDLPAPPQDVVTEAARIMGVAPPYEQDFETAELSPMARSFYGRTSGSPNRKICNLGFNFLFQTYQASLQQLWETGRWKA